MGILVGGALLFRALFLGARAVLQGDEIHYAESLFRFLHGSFLDGVSDYWSFFYPLAGVPFGWAARDAETGLRLLSIAAGAATVVPAVIIARRLAGNRAALFAGLLVALHPVLIEFSTTAATEPLFSLLLLAALAIFMRGADGGGAGAFALSGLFLGLAYLTKPEAQFFPVILVAVLLIGRGAPGLGASRAKRIVRATVLAAAAVAVAIPYFILLRGKTGEWSAGSKAAVNLSSPVIWEDTLERERFVYSLNDAGTGRLIEEIGRENALSVLWREKSRILSSYLPKMSAGFALVPLLLASPVLLLLVPLGLAGRRWRPGIGAAESMLIVAGVFPFAFYSVFRVELRYLVPYLPVYLVWGGIGCGILIDWIGELSGGRRWIRPLAAALVFASLVPFTVRKYGLAARSQQGEWKAVGAWLGRTAGDGERVLAHSGCPASYYAGDPEATYLPWTDAQGLVRFARLKGYRYIIVDERYVSVFRPMLEDLIAESPPELVAARTFDAGDRRIVIYKLGVSPGDTLSD